MNKRQGFMRLQREAKMAKKDIDGQIKKTGKITDNFICLPDPEDVYTWYFIVFGLTDPAQYNGGFYLGKVRCKDNYPASAPNIGLFTDNGKYRTFKQQPDGICLSISDFHPESWNPAWKVSQIVMGLTSFWLDNEYTYGSIESYDYDSKLDLTPAQWSTKWAMESRASVMEHEKFKQIFEPYAAAIGITTQEDLPSWIDLRALLVKKEAERIEAEKVRVEQAKIKAEQDKIAAQEKAKKDAEEKAKYIIENRVKIIQDYFKMVRKQGLTHKVRDLKPNVK